MRARGLGIVAVLAASTPMFSCLPAPPEDFDDYAARTAKYRQSGGATSNTLPPDASLEGLYFGACLSSLAAGRGDRVLRFYTEVEFVKDASGPTGKISLKLTPMKLSPGNGPPPTVSKSETIGATYTVEGAVTNALGVYSAPIGHDTGGNGVPVVKIPGEANPISGREIVMERANLPGRIAPGTFCSQLVGHVVQPTEVTLEGAANTCIYIPVNEGDPTPPIREDGSDFEAGCALE